MVLFLGTRWENFKKFGKKDSDELYDDREQYFLYIKFVFLNIQLFYDNYPDELSHSLRGSLDGFDFYASKLNDETNEIICLVKCESFDTEESLGHILHDISGEVRTQSYLPERKVDNTGIYITKVNFSDTHLRKHMGPWVLNRGIVYTKAGNARIIMFGGSIWTQPFVNEIKSMKNKMMAVFHGIKLEESYASYPLNDDMDFISGLLIQMRSKQTNVYEKCLRQLNLRYFRFSYAALAFKRYLLWDSILRSTIYIFVF